MNGKLSKHGRGRYRGMVLPLKWWNLVMQTIFHKNMGGIQPWAWFSYQKNSSLPAQFLQCFDKTGWFFFEFHLVTQTLHWPKKVFEVGGWPREGVKDEGRSHDGGVRLSSPKSTVSVAKTQHTWGALTERQRAQHWHWPAKEKCKECKPEPFYTSSPIWQPERSLKKGGNVHKDKKGTCNGRSVIIFGFIPE